MRPTTQTKLLFRQLFTNPPPSAPPSPPAVTEQDTKSSWLDGLRFYTPNYRNQHSCSEIRAVEGGPSRVEAIFRNKKTQVIWYFQHKQCRVMPSSCQVARSFRTNYYAGTSVLKLTYYPVALAIFMAPLVARRRIDLRGEAKSRSLRTM